MDEVDQMDEVVWADRSGPGVVPHDSAPPIRVPVVPGARHAQNYRCKLLLGQTTRCNRSLQRHPSS